MHKILQEFDIILTKTGILKHDHRMVRNYLKGVVGDAINVMLSAAAMNFKRIMNIFKMKRALLCQFFQDLEPV